MGYSTSNGSWPYAQDSQSLGRKITFDSRGGTAIESARIGKDATVSMPENCEKQEIFQFTIIVIVCYTC